MTMLGADPSTKRTVPCMLGKNDAASLALRLRRLDVACTIHFCARVCFVLRQEVATV